MKRDQFAELLDLMEHEERNIILTKGGEYTHGHEDRLISFKETANFSGVSPIQVCMIYLNKHYQGLANFVKTGKVLSDEDVYSRIMDLRVYLSLMRALIQEAREKAPVDDAELPLIQHPKGVCGYENCACFYENEGVEA